MPSKTLGNTERIITLVCETIWNILPWQFCTWTDFWMPSPKFEEFPEFFVWHFHQWRAWPVLAALPWTILCKPEGWKNTVNVWNWNILITDIAKIGTLKCPNLRHKVAWVMYVCSKLGQPNCPKLGQTKLGHLGILGHNFLYIKWPRLVSEDFCADFRRSKIGTKVSWFQTVTEIGTTVNVQKRNVRFGKPN